MTFLKDISVPKKYFYFYQDTKGPVKWRFWSIIFCKTNRCCFLQKENCSDLYVQLVCLCAPGLHGDADPPRRGHISGSSSLRSVLCLIP